MNSQQQDRANDRRRAKRIEDKGLRWSIAAMWVSQGAVRADGRGLGMILQFDEQAQMFCVMAAEVSASVKTVDDFLEDHAHAVLGKFEDLAEAKEVAAAYLVKWMRGDTDAVEACDCGPIAAASDA